MKYPILGYTASQRYHGFSRSQWWNLKPKSYIAQYKRFLRLLRQARLDAGLTQVQAAKLLGRPQSFVSKCESGERRVDYVEVQEFASVYKVSIDYFV